MDSFLPIDERLPDVRAGARGFLVVLNHRFTATILQVGQDSLLASVTGENFLFDDVDAALEFHDPDGYNTYPTRIVCGPTESQQAVLLSKPDRFRRMQHRTGHRVRTDLTVQVRDADSLRCYDAALVDISNGGGLIETRAPLKKDSLAEATLSLPEQPVYRVTARVVHVVDEPTSSPRGVRLYGLAFIETPPEVNDGIHQYARHQLEESQSAQRPALHVMHVW
jgi:hypothetical protein